MIDLTLRHSSIDDGPISIKFSKQPVMILIPSLE
jgi:hypothetical protein